MLSIPPEETNPASELPHRPDAYQGALQRLVSGALPQNELTALIETVVLNVNAAEIGERLKRSDAQAFIDVIDQAWAAASLKHRRLFLCLGVR